MDKAQYDALVAKVGQEAADRIKKEMEQYESKSKETMEALLKQGGYLTKEQYEEQNKAANAALGEIKTIVEKQGTTINDLFAKMDTNSGNSLKSIEQVLKEDEEELRKIHQSRSSVKEYMITTNSKGEIVMQAIKAAGPTATIDGVGGGGNTASIAQSLNAATLLRIGGNSPIISQYRNTPWIFDLCNLITAQYVEGQPMAMWYEEIEKQGAPAVTAEGATKPTVQYAYRLKSAEYRKASALVSFTTEFSMDFARLESDIMGKGRTDLINIANSDILSRLTSSATSYNSAASFNQGTGMTNVNEFEVLAAMSAQVDNDTKGAMANAALMSTFKKHRMGVLKDNNGNFLNPPAVLNSLNFVGNSDMAADNVIVGDLKQYNIILRGGIIVRVGYNGNDIADGKFSVVMDQFYYDYISDIRKKAIVKGDTFAAVKALLEA